MQYRLMGRSGVRVSEVGLGTDQFGVRVDQEAVSRIIGQALDQGINMIDTADIYGGGLSEQYLGVALQGHRNEVVIATKGTSRTGPGPNDIGSSRYHLMWAVEQSLRRLRTDHIDLYQMHWRDPQTPLDETMRTLDELVRSGKVRYIGASNYAAWQLAYSNDVAERYGSEPFVTLQPHYNMLVRDAEREIVPCCRRYGVGILPWCPLAGGLLSGRYRRGEAPPSDSRVFGSDWARGYFERYGTAQNLERAEHLQSWAQACGHTLVELAIAWLLAEPAVCSVIAGVSKPEHVAPNARAAEWKLSAEDLRDVRAVLEG